MPNRIIKESICTSDSLDGLGWFEEVLFYRLIVNCDDYGRFDGRTAVIKNRLFPLKENLTLKSVESAINKLATAGLVTLYTSDGKPYLLLPTWNEHQNVRAKKSKYPDPEVICNHLQSIASKCPRNPIQSESNPNTNASNAAAPTRPRFAKPSVEEVATYCREKGYGIDAQHFVDYYDSNGWKVGKNPMQDWRATVRSWARRDGKDKQPAAVGSAKPSAVAMAAIQRMLEEEG